MGEVGSKMGCTGPDGVGLISKHPVRAVWHEKY